MKTVSKVFQAMLTKETTPVWAGRAATPVDGPTAMLAWEPHRRKAGCPPPTARCVTPRHTPPARH